jgi:hypothetical protein
LHAHWTMIGTTSSAHLDSLLRVVDPAVLDLGRQSKRTAGGDVLLARSSVRGLLLLVLVDCKPAEAMGEGWGSHGVRGVGNGADLKRGDEQ